MRVLLVTSWNEACGISEHSAYLKEAVEAADLSVEIAPSATALDPAYCYVRTLPADVDLVHLNYHAALHSRWTPQVIRSYQMLGVKVLVTYHDTGVPNADQCKQVIDAADAAVVHEPFDDLPAEKVRYWRMGVPAPQGQFHFGHSGVVDHPPACFKRYWEQPVLGTVGFPFGWKNYDQLARVTAEAGWALLLIAPTATDEQVAAWQAINPDLWVRQDFVPRSEVVSLLGGCDATAFCYVCHNTGQSAALLQGIAARKPVMAFSSCRQFRALYDDPLGARTIRWAQDFDGVRAYLEAMPLDRVDTGMVALAEQESWTTIGQRYAALYKELVA